MVQESKEEVSLFEHHRLLRDLIDLEHPLVKLAESIDWESLEEELKEAYPSTTGHPNKPIRLMVGLHYLRYMFNLSDERVVWAYLENPYYQYFCGEKVFQHRFPIDRSSLSRFRGRLKKKKLYALLQETIKSGFKTRVLKKQSVKTAVIDSTVQEKNIAYPTDAKLTYKGLVLLRNLAHSVGIQLRQSYIRTGKKLFLKIGRYHHAKQFRRQRKALKKLKSRLGRVVREILRKTEAQSIALNEKDKTLIEQCRRLLKQTRHSKNKLYSFHEPDVACIAKGKTHKRYEFGNKSTFITSAKECFILHAQAHEGNPYDGHTLCEALDAANASLQNLIGQEIETLMNDKGYRGHGYEGNTTILTETPANKKKHKKLRRRSSIEPVFSHVKQHHRMGRNFLKGTTGNQLNTILAACGYNLKKIYNHFLKAYRKRLAFLWCLLFGMVLGQGRRLQWAVTGGWRS
jgi:IS5 family transposase